MRVLAVDFDESEAGRYGRLADSATLVTKLDEMLTLRKGYDQIMIDDQNQVHELIQTMKDQLPIQAYATPALVQSLRQGKTAIEANQPVQIDSVLNLGDMGGIACGLSKFGTVNVVVSITHLRFDESHPLASRIRAYQIHRTQRIDPPVDRTARPSRAQLAQKLKQHRKSPR